MVDKGTNPTTRKRLQYIPDFQDLALDDRRDFIKKKNFDLSVWLTTSILPMIAIKNLQYATSAARNIFKCSVKTELHVEATPSRKGTPNTTNETKTTNTLLLNSGYTGRKNTAPYSNGPLPGDR